MMICLNISSFDFVNNQFQCSTSAILHFNICIVPQFITINGIIIFPLIVDLSFSWLSYMYHGFGASPIIR
jgi:hypothetical protein